MVHVAPTKRDEMPAQGSGNEAAELLKSLDQGDTTEFLRGVLNEFHGTLAVVSSFGAESAVLLHLVAQIDPRVPVLFLNTGKLFGETLRYRDKIQMQLGLTDVRTCGPHPSDIGQSDPNGTLHASDPDLCCSIRKVWPLQEALKPFSAWMTGRKRFQSDARAELPRIEWVDDKVKVNPLADWTADDVAAYRDENRLPVHPLVKDGYLSIGCMPCTDRVAPGEDQRAGRWRGLDRSECGIHDIGASRYRRQVGNSETE